MLKIDNIHAAYGQVKVLYGISFDVQPGEIHCVLGRNGAGKTTIMRSIMGILPIGGGTISLDGEPINTLPPHEIPRKRVGYVPQGRRLFPELTVVENIEMGMQVCNSAPETRDWVLDLFPQLQERLSQQAGTLSGGEQQMLATARALCIKPKVLLLDEPTEGLQPSMIALIREVTLRMRDEGLAVVLVEQRLDAILAVADRATFIENGRNLDAMTAKELRDNPDKVHRYLGV